MLAAALWKRQTCRASVEAERPGYRRLTWGCGHGRSARPRAGWLDQKMVEINQYIY